MGSEMSRRRGDTPLSSSAGGDIRAVLPSPSNTSSDEEEEESEYCWDHQASTSSETIPAVSLASSARDFTESEEDEPESEYSWMGHDEEDGGRFGTQMTRQGPLNPPESALRSSVSSGPPLAAEREASQDGITLYSSASSLDFTPVFFRAPNSDPTLEQIHNEEAYGPTAFDHRYRNARSDGTLALLNDTDIMGDTEHDTRWDDGPIHWMYRIRIARHSDSESEPSTFIHPHFYRNPRSDRTLDLVNNTDIFTHTEYDYVLLNDGRLHWRNRIQVARRSDSVSEPSTVRSHIVQAPNADPTLNNEEVLGPRWNRHRVPTVSIIGAYEDPTMDLINSRDIFGLTEDETRWNIVSDAQQQTLMAPEPDSGNTPSSRLYDGWNGWDWERDEDEEERDVDSLITQCGIPNCPLEIKPLSADNQARMRDCGICSCPTPDAAFVVCQTCSQELCILCALRLNDTGRAPCPFCRQKAPNAIANYLEGIFTGHIRRLTKKNLGDDQQ